ncbi:MAG TPA: glycosyltransferase family 4 protein [Solirubrobacteraceae bacterium]|nr:glycosyltransferase family 4 protein [Solirubrobacteraceae bacterium]
MSADGSARPVCERPARLLLYTDSQELGGAELALGYLLGALTPEIEVAVLSTCDAVGRAIAGHRAGVPVRTVRAPRGRRDRRALAEHVRAVRAFAPDILHGNQAWPWACAYGELAGVLTPGVRVVAVDHLPVSGAIPRSRRLARRLLARRLHAHVAVGERAARLVEQIVGLPRDSVLAVPNGVPAAPVEPLPALAAGPVIGSLGRLTEQKGFDLLVRALPELPTATLVLVGDGPERDALQALARELGVADRLLVTGWSAEPRRHLPGFDVFALPSRWEGMPLGILEAMHAGLPVLATDVGSVAEAVLDGDSGYVVAADDLPALRGRLARLLDDPALRRRMGERGRAVARERFTDTAMARRYEDLYARLLGRPLAPGAAAERATATTAGG